MATGGPSCVRVLLVEDNVVNQRVASVMLERAGCHVDVAANGVEAVEATAHVEYDLVFMDCQMPEMDGFEATRRIRARDRSASRVPIIALTANAMSGDRDRCLAAGMDGYIGKPFGRAELARAIETWGRSRSRAA